MYFSPTVHLTPMKLEQTMAIALWSSSSDLRGKVRSPCPLERRNEYMPNKPFRPNGLCAAQHPQHRYPKLGLN